MPFTEKLGIFFFSGLIIAGTGLAILAILWVISQAPGWRRGWKGFLYLGGLLPASFLAVTILTLIDNFTYTVFKFGILTARGFQRGAYTATFVSIWIVCAWWVMRRLSRQSHRKRMGSLLKGQLFSCGLLLAVSAALGVSLFRTALPDERVATVKPAAKNPNILLIGTDGLDADHTSVYNAATDTTPFLKSFSQSTLLAENNFPNANETAGSLVSLFTGKLPTTTRTLYPPDILKGSDAFEHLPEILKSQGYYNAEISVDYYADMNNLNLQDSFVMVNGRSTTLGSLYTLSREIIPEDTAYFLSSVVKGLSDRLLQIFFVRTVSNPYAEVTLPLVDMNDQNRVDQLMNLFKTVHQPLFLHVHMMGTHLSEWATYDQAIQAYDGYMKEVIADLTQIGQLDNTLIIIYTDHGFLDVTNVRIPLMIRFPNEEYAGKITHNTQNLDIAPTILDYLGLQAPSWMAGQSLLNGEPPANRPIFSAAPNYQTANTHNELQLDLSKIKPPFYQFGSIGMVICQRWYALNTSQLAWQEGDIAGYPTPCAADSLPDASHAHQILIDQLESDGFDIT
ncbi:MAG TPA: sulfatase-like hydrolase/transferase, partial [Anaerolineaceae bacterium]